MSRSQRKAVAVVGVGALMPDARNAVEFWQNIKDGRYSISDVPRSRWNSDLYYSEDLNAPDKLYSKIGGWVKDFEWEPLKWKLPIPPKVDELMDLTQKYAIIATREALADYGYPDKTLDTERTAVIFGNAMGGDNHLLTAARILFPEYAEALSKSEGFAMLPAADREKILAQMYDGIDGRFPPITEDTMPGEISNITSGRICSLYNLRGPNFTTDAACASAMAALDAAIEGLEENEFDTVITGGIDANMSPNTYVKFCKIGALSATGTRPYADGADGFVMGEGAAVFVIKRLADAERDGDKIYAVIRSIGGSSDGKGKGITAPNPIGQKLAVERAWKNADLKPAAGDLIEGHGTSTRVGDLVEAQCLDEFFRACDLPTGSVSLGSVKSNIGHLKGGAGAAGLFKAAMAVHEKVLPPSVNFHKPNPGIDFSSSPLKVNTELRDWEPNAEGVRRAGVSAFGFGGTNFHAVVEDYVPGRIDTERKTMMSVGEKSWSRGGGMHAKAPFRGALVLGAKDDDSLRARLEEVRRKAEAGEAPPVSAPLESDLRADVRIAIDYADAAELADKAARALDALAKNEPARWKVLRAKGVFIGRGRAPKVAFLFTGQGSQYVNMLADLRDIEPIIDETYKEADRTMLPVFGKPLTDYIFVDPDDEAAMKEAHEKLKQTVITQPAVLATETAFLRLLSAYGIEPDMVMGHSLGEYGALVAAGALPFSDGLRAVSARGGAMTAAATDDNGLMAAVQARVEDIEAIISKVDGYVVVANNNSTKESVIGGATKAVEVAMEALRAAGYTVTQLPVSHAFHTQIVAAAAENLVGILQKMNITPPKLPVIANVTGDFYPSGSDVEPEMIDILARQVASPVQFVRGLNKLYDSGARVFIELGPKRALYGFADDVVGSREGVTTLFTNHPRVGGVASFNQALCGLYAQGLGDGIRAAAPVDTAQVASATGATASPASQTVSDGAPTPPVGAGTPADAAGLRPVAAGRATNAGTTIAPASAGTAMPATGANPYEQLGHLFADFLDRGMAIYRGEEAGTAPHREPTACITGAALGLPGTDRVFDDSNVERILSGQQLISSVPKELRDAMAGKRITRLIKGEDGDARFETIDSANDVIKLAGRAGKLDLHEEFGFPEERIAAFDRVTQLALGAGIDALRDAGIPLVMRYKTTTKGTLLPDRWILPEHLRDGTGVVFGSAFAGYDSFAKSITDHERSQALREKLAELEGLRSSVGANETTAMAVLDKRIEALRAEIAADDRHFNRRFLLRVLAMGHSQFAEYIGARGPNTAINTACATGTHSIGVAQDWIRTGRCRRVIVVTADDVTTDSMFEWFGSGFLASGAAATDERVEDAALPFDRRRHGLVIGMGAAAYVVESEEAAAERGIRPICEVMGTIRSNSGFHGTRLDVTHIGGLMEKLISDAEARWGISRHDLARELVFVSHETYTPARGGSASAEVFALRNVFGESANNIVIANTKGFTGHPMGVAIEDVVAMKALETGVIPPVANFREVDPELGELNLSKGGPQPVRYALRLGAGFGSQINMALLRWVPTPDGTRPRPGQLGVHTRVADAALWNNWLVRNTGHGANDLEVHKRTLRVKDGGPVTLDTPSMNAPRPTAATPPGPGTQPGGMPPRPVASPPEAPVQMSETVSDPPRPIEAPPAAAPSEVEETVLRIVSEKTGYPPDMLDLDLDLEADLGIDTVKQAETFAAIRETYDIPRDDNLKLRDYPTLASTIQFVYEKRPDLAEAAAAAQSRTQGPAVAETPAAATVAADAAPATFSESAAVGASDQVRDTVVRIVSEVTGYPADMLDLDLDLEADLGIDTVKQAETFAAIRAAYDIPRDDNLKLRDYPTLAATIQFVYEKRPDLAAATPQAGSARTGSIDTPAPTAMAGTATVSASPAPVAGAATAAPAPASQAGIIHPAAPDGVDPEIRDTVLKIVADKTGYPPDMLDLDLDLEADLGIDTVKQAEMFAAIREAYDIPRDDNLKLRDYPTLAHTMQFVVERRPKASAGAAVVEEAAPAAVPAAQTGDGVTPRIPVAQLRADIDFCKATGVTLDAGKRVLVMCDRGGVGNSLAGRLDKLGVEALTIDDSPSDVELIERIAAWKTDAGIDGVYWLPALDDEGAVADMDIDTWRSATHRRVKLLYTALRALYDDMDAPGAFLVSATRMGGRHGYDSNGAHSPLGGGVSGLTKSFKREKPSVLAKCVDFAPSRKTAALADQLIDETLRDPGVVEIGYHDDRRWTVGLDERSAPADAGNAVPLDANSVFVITGAAGGIVSEITADLARHAPGTFHLLDLAPAPADGDNDVARFASDKEGLKREIFERLKAKGERATPIMVEKEIGAIERRYAARSAIDAIERAGGKAVYHSVNLLDADAMRRVMNTIRQSAGRVDVLLHAAGLEVSKSLPDKSPEEFNLVFDVKADGWFNLISNLEGVSLGSVVVFSSIAGRFGNAGQADYSSANDLLCKSMSALRRERPETLPVAIDWTAWEAIGMASRGSIPAIMARAGIDMLQPEVGIPFVREELTRGHGGEVVVARGLGAMLEEFDETGGLDVGPESRLARMVAGHGIMSQRVTGMGIYSGLTVETTLDPNEQPFLRDHQIDGTPVLPGVMGIEALVEAASLLFPDLSVATVEDVEFSVPFKFYRAQPRTVTAHAVFDMEGGDVVARCRLTGERKLHGHESAEVTEHFSARVRMNGNTRAADKRSSVQRPGEQDRLPSADIYKVYFHGPAYQVLDASWRAGSAVLGAYKHDLPANANPADRPELAAPRLIELCFQTAGISEMAGSATMGLPHHIDGVEFRGLPKKKPADASIFASVTERERGIYDAEVVDQDGNVYLSVRGYRTMQMPTSIKEDLLATLREKMK